MSGLDVTASDAQASDLLAVLETNTAWTARIGAALPGDETPLVAAWLIAPIRTGEGFASESGGMHIDVWQINCFGSTIGQAKAVRNALIGLAWPTGWELDDVGPALPDTAERPLGYYIPVDMRYTPQVAL